MNSKFNSYLENGTLNLQGKRLNVSIDSLIEYIINNKNLIQVNLINCNLVIDPKNVEHLAIALKSIPNMGLYLSPGYQELFNFIRNENININTTTQTLLKIAPINKVGNIVKYLIQKDPTLININASDHQGMFLLDYYSGNPEMQAFLFKHGAIPQRNPTVNKDNTLEQIALGKESVLNKKLGLNFTISNLFKKLDVTYLKESEKSVSQDLSQLFKNQNRISFLSLSLQEKENVLEGIKDRTLIKQYKDNNILFVQDVIKKAQSILDTQYLCKDDKSNYKGIYATHKFYYDDEYKKTVTIPNLIGLIKLLIDQSEPDIEEKKELCISAFENSSITSNKFDHIKQILDNNDINIQDLSNRPKIHSIFSQNPNINLDDLFYATTKDNLKEVWQEQKLFVLAKQLYIAATTYGESSSACLEGTYAQILNAAVEISPTLTDEFIKYTELKNKQENLKSSINKDNITEYSNELAKYLIDVVTHKKINLQNTLKDMILYIEDDDIKKQQIYQLFNEFFTQNIKKYLPNYNATIPTKDEYNIIIEKCFMTKKMENFVQEETEQKLRPKHDNNVIKKFKDRQSESKFSEQDTTQVKELPVPPKPKKVTYTSVDNAPHLNTNTESKQASLDSILQEASKVTSSKTKPPVPPKPKKVTYTSVDNAPHLNINTESKQASLDSILQEASKVTSSKTKPPVPPKPKKVTYTSVDNAPHLNTNTESKQASLDSILQEASKVTSSKTKPPVPPKPKKVTYTSVDNAPHLNINTESKQASLDSILQEASKVTSSKTKPPVPPKPKKVTYTSVDRTQQLNRNKKKSVTFNYKISTEEFIPHVDVINGKIVYICDKDKNNNKIFVKNPTIVLGKNKGLLVILGIITKYKARFINNEGDFVKDKRQIKQLTSNMRGKSFTDLNGNVLGTFSKSIFSKEVKLNKGVQIEFDDNILLDQNNKVVKIEKSETFEKVKQNLSKTPIKGILKKKNNFLDELDSIKNIIKNYNPELKQTKKINTKAKNPRSK